MKLLKISLTALIVWMVLPLSAYGQSGTRDEWEILSEFEIMKRSLIETEKGWELTKVVEVGSATKEQIYAEALKALSLVYLYTEKPIRTKDSEVGLIVAKGFINSGNRSISTFNYARNRCWLVTVVEVKDSRAKITITIDSVWWETGAELGSQFQGSKYPLDYFYPYSSNWSASSYQMSFDNLRFAYQCTTDALNTLAHALENTVKNSRW